MVRGTVCRGGMVAGVGGAGWCVATVAVGSFERQVDGQGDLEGVGDADSDGPVRGLGTRVLVQARQPRRGGQRS
eukprot:scaffold20365_cov132-Isochrysis_galbana.AAC.4